MRGEGDRSCNECVDLLLVSSIKMSPEEEQSLRRKPPDFLIFNDEDNILRFFFLSEACYITNVAKSSFILLKFKIGQDNEVSASQHAQ